MFSQVFNMHFLLCTLHTTVDLLSLSDDLKADRAWIATTITQSINYIQLSSSSAYSI